MVELALEAIELVLLAGIAVGREWLAGALRRVLPTALAGAPTRAGSRVGARTPTTKK